MSKVIESGLRGPTIGRTEYQSQTVPNNTPVKALTFQSQASQGVSALDPAHSYLPDANRTKHATRSGTMVIVYVDQPGYDWQFHLHRERPLRLKVHLKSRDRLGPSRHLGDRHVTLSEVAIRIQGQFCHFCPNHRTFAIGNVQRDHPRWPKSRLCPPPYSDNALWDSPVRCWLRRTRTGRTTRQHRKHQDETGSSPDYPTSTSTHGSCLSRSRQLVGH